MVFGFDPGTGYTGLLAGKRAVVVYTGAVDVGLITHMVFAAHQRGSACSSPALTDPAASRAGKTPSTRCSTGLAIAKGLAPRCDQRPHDNLLPMPPTQRSPHL
jgi:hypothetical protein